jgi:hypothetical protein
MFRDFAVCLSLAHLLSLTQWDDLQRLYSAPMNYYRKSHPDATLLVATICVEMLLAVLFWLVLLAVRASRRRWARAAAEVAFLLVLIAPLNMLQKYLHQDGISPAVMLGGTYVIFSFQLMMIAGCVFVVWRKDRTLARAARAAVLVLSPLLLVSGLHLYSRIPHALELQDRPLAPPLSRPAGNRARVVWLVFDELDQRLVFEERPDSIRLPEFDRLRGEALYACGALPAAEMTMEALPALLTGRTIVKATPLDSDRLMLSLQDDGKTTLWEANDTLPARVRRLGLNSAVVAWYHPYGRILHSVVSDCEWLPGIDATPLLRREEYAGEAGVLKSTLRVAEGQVSSGRLERIMRRLGFQSPDVAELQLLRRRNLKDYLSIREKALAAVRRSDFGFALIHLPVPHPLGIYDRRTGTYSTRDDSNYIDNLELADRTLGEIRRAMEESGTWETTHVLVTSDHPLRPRIWNHRPTWSSEMAQATRGKSFRFVPFLLSLGGQKGFKAEFSTSFSTLLMHDLTLELLAGRFQNLQQVTEWLTENRSKFLLNDSNAP